MHFLSFSGIRIVGSIVMRSVFFVTLTFPCATSSVVRLVVLSYGRYTLYVTLF